MLIVLEIEFNFKSFTRLVILYFYILSNFDLASLLQLLNSMFPTMNLPLL